MKTSTILILSVLLGCLVLSMIPDSQAKVSKARKLRILRKIAPFSILLKKKYMFAVPFPLPIPIPILKKTQPIIYKEKVAVPVPVAEPVPEPVPIPEPVYDQPYAAASYEQPHYQHPPEQHHAPAYDEPHY